MFAERFIRSESFRALYDEIMRLVEEARIYIGGKGCVDVADLGQEGRIAYAAWSMHLTTQVLNMAAWAMLLRTVETGEKNFAEVVGEMPKFESEFHRKKVPDHSAQLLPEEMLGLLGSSERLRLRGVRLMISFTLAEKADRVGELAAVFDDTG